MTTTTTVVDTIPTPDGPFTVLVDGDDVIASGWTSQPDAVLARLHPADRPESLRRAATTAGDAVRAYYDGDVAAIMAVPVRQCGTRLQLDGWAALREIEPGRPLSYAELAAAVGRPSAVRAAASICARNAAALFVPCHRVRRSDGSLGGFAWGLAVKQSLLEREAAR